MSDGPSMCPGCAACRCGRAAHDRDEIESVRRMWDERGREIDRLNNWIEFIEKRDAAAKARCRELEGALLEAETALTWALGRSPQACQSMVKESAPWRVKARAALKGKP